MSHTIHHAIIVSAHAAHIPQAHTVAGQIFAVVSDPLATGDGWWSFFIPPDGSKEGWPDSDAGDEARAQFHHWIAAQAYEDGSNPYAAVEVAYKDVMQPLVTVVAGVRVAYECGTEE